LRRTLSQRRSNRPRGSVELAIDDARMRGDMELWVTELSLTPRFDPDAALALAAARRHAVGRADWERLRHFSFLEPQPDGFYRLHATMRAALRARVALEGAREVHEWFRSYWMERGQGALGVAVPTIEIPIPVSDRPMTSNMDQRASAEGPLATKCYNWYFTW
jgi:hypothetical protein